VEQRDDPTLKGKPVAACEAVDVTRIGDEIGEFAGTATDVVFVERALAKPPEEAWRVTFKDVAARRKESRPRGDFVAKRNEIGSVAFRAMEKENRRKGWVGAELKAVNIS
jgi:hypothetical protein